MLHSEMSKKLIMFTSAHYEVHGVANSVLILTQEARRGLLAFTLCPINHTQTWFAHGFSLNSAILCVFYPGDLLLYMD